MKRLLSQDVGLSSHRATCEAAAAAESSCLTVKERSHTCHRGRVKSGISGSDQGRERGGTEEWGGGGFTAAQKVVTTAHTPTCDS